MRDLPFVLASAALLLATQACQPKPAATRDDAGDDAAPGDAPLDPTVLGLVTRAEKCPLEGGRFHACPDADAFRDSDAAAFAGDKGDALLLTLLTSTNERWRVLATSRSMSDSARLLSTKSNAERLLGQLERETNPVVREALVSYAGQIDVEKLGLLDRLKALAASKDPAVRSAVAANLLYHDGPVLREELVGSLLNDPEENVRLGASAALYGAAMSGRSDGLAACAPLAQALDGEHVHDVLWHAASASRCAGLQAKALTYIEAHTAKPESVTYVLGLDYTLALGGLCESKDADLRARAYDVALRLASPADHDLPARLAATRHLGKCDPVRAKTALGKLSADKDPDVAAQAKDTLAKLAAPKN